RVSQHAGPGPAGQPGGLDQRVRIAGRAQPADKCVCARRRVPNLPAPQCFLAEPAPAEIARYPAAPELVTVEPRRDVMDSHTIVLPRNRNNVRSVPDAADGAERAADCQQDHAGDQADRSVAGEPGAAGRLAQPEARVACRYQDRVGDGMADEPERGRDDKRAEYGQRKAGWSAG